MSNIAIKVENIGKKYLIKHEQKESYQTFQNMLLNGSNNFNSNGIIICREKKRTTVEFSNP